MNSDLYSGGGAACSCATRSCSFLDFVDTFAADFADSFGRSADSSSCFLDFDNCPGFPSKRLCLI